MLRFAIALSLFALAACGNSDPGPGGVTANEAAALDDAAEMIESQRLPEEALRPPPGEGRPAGEAPPAK